MRVLMLAQTFRPAQGGGPRWTTELAEGLAGAGHDVLVLTHEFGGRRGTEQSAPRLEIRYMPLLTIRGAPIFPRRMLDDYVARFKPDVIQTSAPSLADMLMPSPRRYGVPYATLFHAQLGASIPALAVQSLNVRRLKRGDWAAIAVTSDYWKAWLTGKGVRADRIAVIPSTVAKIFSAPLAGSRRGPGQLLFVGGLDAVQSYKRFDLLLAACSMLGGGAWHLNVVGDGNLRSQFERATSDAGLDDRISFFGRTDDATLHRLYSTAAVTVLASSDRREGWGLALAEALCCGCPVLFTAGIGGASTFGRAPGAVMVEAGKPEALRDGLRNFVQNAPDGRDAERVAFGESFHASRVVAAYEAMYERAIAAFAS